MRTTTTLINIFISQKKFATLNKLWSLHFSSPITFVIRHPFTSPSSTHQAATTFCQKLANKSLPRYKALHLSIFTTLQPTDSNMVGGMIDTESEDDMMDESSMTTDEAEECHLAKLPLELVQEIVSYVGFLL